MRALTTGRRELCAALQRTRHKEALERSLVSLEANNRKKLRGCAVLGVAFHVRDLIATGDLVRHRTATGVFLRVGATSRFGGGGAGRGARR